MITTDDLLDILKAYARVSELTPEELKELHDSAATLIMDIEDGIFKTTYITPANVKTITISPEPTRENLTFYCGIRRIGDTAQ